MTDDSREFVAFLGMIKPEDLGDIAINTIIESSLFKVDDVGLVVWSANAQEQIGEAIIEYLKRKTI